VSRELVRLIIKRLGYTRKKAKFYGKAKNALFLNKAFLKRRDYYIENEIPIFSIDETGFGRFSYANGYGYSMKGTPLYIMKNQPRVTSKTVIACASLLRNRLG